MTIVAQAAVLITYQMIRDDPHFIFIERAHHDHDPHSGQVAFPGGRFDLSDKSLKMTALREAEEEVGLPADCVAIIARLPEIKTGTGFAVTPFLAELIKEFTPVLDKTEVASIFTIPVRWIVNADFETRTLERNNQQFEVIYYQPYNGKVLWGASARMARMAISELKSLGKI